MWKREESAQIFPKKGRKMSRKTTQKAKLTLSKNLFEYQSIIKEFQCFLEDTKNMKMKMLLRHRETLQLKKVEMEIMTRWKKAYKNRVLARFYKLNDYFNEVKPDYTFVTLTTRQDMSLEQQYEFIKANFRKLRDVMRKALGKFPYVWVTEPHGTGYTHIHMLAFVGISENLQEHFKEIWQDKYEAGSKKAMDFSSNINGGNIRSVKNYLMKYISKSLDSLKNPEILLYNSVAWNMSRRKNEDSKGFRFYGMSKDLTKLCKLSERERGHYYCVKQYIITNDGKKIEVLRLGDLERLQEAYSTLYNNITDENICLSQLM